MRSSRTPRFVSEKLKSGYFFSNVKTEISADFKICPFMKKKENGGYESKTCPGCYSANMMNVRVQCREKLEKAPKQSEKQLKIFRQLQISTSQKKKFAVFLIVSGIK